MLRAHSAVKTNYPYPISYRTHSPLQDEDSYKYARRESLHKTETRASVAPSTSKLTSSETRSSGFRSPEPTAFTQGTGWLCCADKKSHVPTRQWQESLRDIAGFFRLLLANPPPEEHPTEFDPQPCAYLFEILTYHKPNIVDSSRHFTFQANGAVIKHTFAKGLRPSFERKKRFKYFEEMVARYSWRCKKHCYEHIISLYRPPVDQNFFCCSSDLIEGLPPDIFTYDRSHIIQGSFCKWIESLETGQAFLMHPACHRTMFEIFKEPKPRGAEPSKRYVMFDALNGIQELGKAGNLPFPDYVSVRAFPGTVSILRTSCEQHDNQYIVLAFELDDYDIFSTERIYPTPPAPVNWTPVIEYAAHVGSEKMQEEQAEMKFHKRPATPPKRWPGVIGDPPRREEIGRDVWINAKRTV